MTPRSLAVLLLLLTFAATANQAAAYSYASPASDPLIVGREAYLDAVNKGDWAAVEKAVAGFKSDLDVLEKGDDAYSGDPGITKAFSDAVANKDAAAAKAALHRAYIDQIDRRLSGAEKNIKTFQTAKILVVTAQTFFTTMAGDLPADTRKTVSDAMTKALDAIGKPGVFGYGAKPADPAALKQAHAAIIAALKGGKDDAGSGS